MKLHNKVKLYIYVILQITETFSPNAELRHKNDYMNANILTRFQFNELNGEIQSLPHLPIVVYTIPLWRRAFIRNVTSHIRYFGTNLLRIRMVYVNFKRMKNWRKVEKCRFFVEIQTPWQTFLCGETPLSWGAKHLQVGDET